ncbi:MAG: hypothetical protein WD278_04590 [Pirellulales bacterium]
MYNRLMAPLGLAVIFAVSCDIEGYGQNPSDAPRSAVSPDAELPALVRSAADGYVQPDETELARRLGELRQALDRLERYLAPAGANGQAWKRFLLVNEVTAELDRGLQADLSVLETAARRYRGGHAGLELPRFSQAGEALRSYIDTAALVRSKEAHSQFQTAIEQLAGGLEEYDATGSSEALDKAAEAVAWLARYRQAPGIVQAVRGRFSRPNLYARVSRELLDAAIARPVDETAPVRDVILGTRVSGTGRTVGQVAIRLLPSRDTALFETEMRGTNYARTVGRNGPARIHSSAQTRIYGRKRFVLDGQGMRAYPASASATTQSTVRGISSTKRGLVDCLVKRVARKRVGEQKALSERIAARHAEQRFNARFESQAGGLLARVNDRIQGRDRHPLLRRGPTGDQIRFSTTEDELRVTAIEQPGGRLAAAQAPPDVAVPASLSVRMHESFFNNLAEEIFAGQTLDQAQAERLALDVLGSIPAELRDSEREEAWSITFASRRPISVLIHENTVSITVRGQRYTSGRRQYSGMNVTARYELARREPGMTAARQGELEIFPPGFVPGSGRRLALRQQTLRNLLKHRFEGVFPPEIVSEGLELPGQAARAGRLELRQLTAEDGWLSVAWQQASGSRLAAAR